MKFTLTVASIPLFILPVLTTSTTSVSFDPIFDDGSTSLDRVACSDGKNGLITRGFTTFASLPSFPNIGGAFKIAGWNSPECGTCWNLTYAVEGKTIGSVNILAIDTSEGEGFNIAEAAMNTLTGGEAVHDGVVKGVLFEQVAEAECGL
jgi:hypothetical protein